MNARVVLRVNSGVVLAIGVAMVAPLILSLLYEDGSLDSFLLPVCGMILAGALELRLTRLPPAAPLP